MDNQNPPEVRLIYHANGEIAEVNISLPIPRAPAKPSQSQNPPLKRKRSRLDSGFDDEDPNSSVTCDTKLDETLAFNKVLEEEEEEESTEILRSKELRMDLTTQDAGEEAAVSSAEPMIKSDKKFDFKETSSFSHIVGIKQPFVVFLLVLVVVLLLGLAALFIVHFSHGTGEVSERENNSTKLLNFHRLHMPTFFDCPPECFQKSKRFLSVTNGRAACRDNVIQVECEPGFDVDTRLSVTCEDLDQTVKPVQCLPSSRCKVKNSGGVCGPDILLIAGGEFDGDLVDTIETFPLSAYSACLPPLPRPLKWASLAFLGNSLILCGGENSAEQPSKRCWVLETGRQWKWFGDLAR